MTTEQMLWTTLGGSTVLLIGLIRYIWNNRIKEEEKESAAEQMLDNLGHSLILAEIKAIRETHEVEVKALSRMVKSVEKMVEGVSDLVNDLRREAFGEINKVKQEQADQGKCLGKLKGHMDSCPCKDGRCPLSPGKRSTDFHEEEGTPK